MSAHDPLRANNSGTESGVVEDVSTRVGAVDFGYVYAASATPQPSVFLNKCMQCRRVSMTSCKDPFGSKGCSVLPRSQHQPIGACRQRNQNDSMWRAELTYDRSGQARQRLQDINGFSRSPHDFADDIFA